MEKKKCENCLDYIVCLQEKTLQETPCSRWKIDFHTYQGIFEKLNTKDEEKVDEYIKVQFTRDYTE